MVTFNSKGQHNTSVPVRNEYYHSSKKTNFDFSSEEGSQSFHDKPIDKLYITALSTSFTGLEVCYSAQSLYEVPILTSAGLSQRYIPILWCLAPCLALIIQPYLSNQSDYCYSRLGRRRPFILSFAIGILIGLILLGFGKTFGYLIENSRHYNVAAIVVIAIGIWFMDYFTNAMRVPIKALLLDSTCGHSQTANNISTILTSVGTLLGYGICR